MRRRRQAAVRKPFHPVWLTLQLFTVAAGASLDVEQAPMIVGLGLADRRD